jgi:exosortase/archaeosortase family protein
MDHFSVKLARECSAIFLVIPFISFIIAHPSPMKDKGVGMLFGIPFLYSLNAFRIALILIIGTMSPFLAEGLHIYFGQVAMILAIVCLCLLWLKVVVTDNSMDSDMQFVKSVTILSGVMFPVWIYLKSFYASAMQTILLFMLKSAGFEMSSQISINQGLFTTMNLLTFSALVCAYPALKAKNRIGVLLIGLVALSFVHVMHAGFELLLIWNHVCRPIAAVNALLILIQWVLPFILWRFFLNRFFTKS